MPAIAFLQVTTSGDYQYQLCLEDNDGKFRYIIYSQYQPGGSILKRCVLESGEPNFESGSIIAAGEAAFKRLTAQN